jgi:hypothetical protein
MVDSAFESPNSDSNAAHGTVAAIKRPLTFEQYVAAQFPQDIVPYAVVKDAETCERLRYEAYRTGYSDRFFGVDEVCQPRVFEKCDMPITFDKLYQCSRKIELEYQPERFEGGMFFRMSGNVTSSGQIIKGKFNGKYRYKNNVNIDAGLYLGIRIFSLFDHMTQVFGRIEAGIANRGSFECTDPNDKKCKAELKTKQEEHDYSYRLAGFLLGTGVTIRQFFKKPEEWFNFSLDLSSTFEYMPSLSADPFGKAKNATTVATAAGVGLNFVGAPTKNKGYTDSCSISVGALHQHSFAWGDDGFGGYISIGGKF